MRQRALALLRWLIPQLTRPLNHPIILAAAAHFVRKQAAK